MAFFLTLLYNTFDETAILFSCGYFCFGNKPKPKIMKILLSLFVVCISSFSLLNAQPLLEPMMFPTEGIGVEMVSPIDTLNSDEGPAGADVVWDFDHWKDDPETYFTGFGSTLGYLNASDELPDATMGRSWYDSIYFEEYYQKTPAIFSLVGVWSQNGTLFYTDHELLLVANMAYNDTFTDTYHAQSQGIDYNYVLNGEKWTTYDGYGILKIQGSSFPNAIRLRTEQTWRDTFFYENGIVSLRSFDRTAYQWYYTFKCGPNVAFYYTKKHEENWLGNILLDSSTTQPILHKTMLNACTHAKTKELKTLPGIKMNLSGANPVHEVLQVLIESETASRKLQVQLFDAFGTMVYSQPVTMHEGELKLEIPVGLLASGVYVVVLSDGKGRISKRWVKM